MTKKTIFFDDSRSVVENITPYLTNGETVVVFQRSTPLYDVPKLVLGNMPKDGGGLIVKKEDLPQVDETGKKWIREYIGATEFINNKKRYCLWMKDASPAELTKSQFVRERLKFVKEFREASKKKETAAWAESPWLFVEIRQPATNYLIIPRTSSENRRYVPIGYLPPEIIVSDACTILPDANLFSFGVITSNVHMSWMRTVCGRLKSDYRYSGNMVYNTFPWPSPTSEQKEKIEKTAQGILDARALYPDSSLADLYDPLTMPPELRKAHQLNDKAVMQAYGMPIKETDEAACVAWLMKLYQEKVNNME